MDVLKALRQASLARMAEWHPDVRPDLSFRGNELAGETGEACNVIKKLERERLGHRGSRDTVAHLAEEIADVIIVAEIIAQEAGFELGPAIIAKFNDTSEKYGLSTRMSAQEERK
jgi:NTP pyrophosphatase (non-canonical NTP hydrolase)